jgi:hypothetical protein
VEEHKVWWLEAVPILTLKSVVIEQKRTNAMLVYR